MVEAERFDGNIVSHEVNVDSTSEPSGLGTQGDPPGRSDAPSEDSGTESRLTPPPSGSVPCRHALNPGCGGASLCVDECQPPSDPHKSEEGRSLCPGGSSAPRSDGDGEAVDVTESALPKCIGWRVDALVVAYRVQLSSEARDALRNAAGVALSAGKAELRLPIPGKPAVREQDFCICQVQVQKGERVIFENGDIRGVFLECLAVEDPGWSLELVARASYLANHSLEDVVEELRTWARAFGPSQEERLRRVDLCADFESLPILPDDADAFVRPPRSTMTSWCEGRKPDESWTKTYREASDRVTGHTVCPGNALMLRIYNKTQEMKIRHGEKAEKKRQLEHAIWTENGWTGGDVTRVEFQIRGEAAKELLGRQVDRLLKERQALWRYCVEKWVRLVLPDGASRLRRCPTDPRWEAVQRVRWGKQQSALRRVRSRGLATANQAWGTLLTALAQSGTVPEGVIDRDENLRTVAKQDDVHARGALSFAVLETVEGFAVLAEQALISRHEGDALAALEFVVQRARAAVARAHEEKRSEEEEPEQEEAEDGERHQVEPDLQGSNRQRVGIDGDAYPRGEPDTERAETVGNPRSSGSDGTMDVGEAARQRSHHDLLRRVLARGKSAREQAEGNVSR